MNPLKTSTIRISSQCSRQVIHKILSILLFLPALSCFGQNLYVDSLRNLVNSGDALSTLRLAQCYNFGFGVPKDSLMVLKLSQYAVRLCKKQAKKGDSDAQLNMGRALIQLRNKEDSISALKWTLKSARQGNLYAMYNLGMWYREGIAVDKDMETSINWLQKAAIGGLGIAQQYLGNLYEYGGAPLNKDMGKAFYWYSKAAGQGLLLAKLDQVVFYHDGIGVEKNLKLSYELMKEAVDHYFNSPTYFHGISLRSYIAETQRIPAACLCIGEGYANGIGFEQDFVRAAEYYTKGAELGNAESMNSLANLYKEGNGVIKSPSKAIELYKRAAALGNDYAMTNLAVEYDSGENIERNEELALYWLKKSADVDTIRGNRILGHFYLDKGDTAKAISSYRIAAELNDSISLYCLGWCYSEKGHVQDYAKALYWLKKSASTGNSHAIALLGDFYDRGYGVQVDKREAALYYAEAARLGLPYAQCQLACCYLFGKGTVKDVDQAIEWAQKSSDNGFLRSKALLGYIYYYPKGEIQYTEDMTEEEATEENKKCKEFSLKGLSLLLEASKNGDESAKDLLEMIFSDDEVFQFIDSINGIDVYFNREHAYFVAIKEQQLIKSFEPEGLLANIDDHKLFH